MAAVQTVWLGNRCMHPGGCTASLLRITTSESNYINSNWNANIRKDAQLQADMQ